MSSKSARYIFYPIMFSYVNARKGQMESIKLGLGFSKESTRGKVIKGIYKGTIIINSHKNPYGVRRAIKADRYDDRYWTGHLHGF